MTGQSSQMLIIPEEPTGKFLKDDMSWAAVEGLGTHLSDYTHANIHANTLDHSNSLDHSNANDHPSNADTDLDATFEAAIKNTDNHTSGTTNKVFTATEQTKLAGITFSGLVKITVGITEPSTPSSGDLWVDTN